MHDRVGGLRRGCRPRRRRGLAALGSPQARKASGWRRARARLSGGRGPPTLLGLVPASGWGRAWASRPEGKVNSTLPLSFPRTPPVALLSLARRRGWFENFCFFCFFCIVFEKRKFSFFINLGFPPSPPRTGLGNGLRVEPIRCRFAPATWVTWKLGADSVASTLQGVYKNAHFHALRRESYWNAS